MLDTALKLLKKIEKKGFQAYIVGGFVRDYILGVPSSDIDICTDATPMDIKKIFKGIFTPKVEYGSVTVFYHNIRFEITTFRHEITYINNRKPIEFEYIKNLKDDLLRRDFIINTICMDSNGNIIDLLNGRRDLNNKEINTVGNSYLKFNEDSLRILRAIRFATILNFRLSDEVKQSIKLTKNNLTGLSYDRKKEELNKIFSSSNYQYGLSLLKELDLCNELEIYNIDDIINNKNHLDVISVWSILKVGSKYPFSKNEQELINKIREVIDKDNLNNLVLYNYGLYVNMSAAIIKGIDKKDVVSKYEHLPIKNKNDIAITSNDIMRLLNKEGGPYIRDIYKDITNLILNDKLRNNKKELEKYILQNY